ncbi:hypothetical protein A2V49_03095 [candidate division WWE3 bacterium RBG_19FT_COMBO_34_6]|uniref:Lactamase n=1 Tax=candidate division WWE3 bacterium RBG_19FT_COMBO_34_6 TaxID=1802612 RepID=A0A1F4UKD9_UNCKA|nr:MAG: hypothetical protein A2V49_03095 [candidate division WWE3 bacterium RBG_19FT_COMBO_34_6]
MEITYIGHSCFKIKGKNITLVIDPYNPKMTGYPMPKISADAVLITHEHEDHSNLQAINDYKILINTPGEYELSETFIFGIQTYHDNKNGNERGKNTIYQIDIDGFSLLHLGDLGHELSTDTLERLGSIDVLMVPVGGTYTINGEVAAKVISSIEPAIVIPMHYHSESSPVTEKLDDIKKFMEEMGSKENGIKSIDKLKLTSRLEVPEETEVYLLSPQH